MFKQAVFVVLETLAFLALFLGFSVLLPGLNKIPPWRVHVSATHDFNPTGVLAMLALWVLFLAISAARKRLKAGGMRSTLALVMALCLGLAAKFGFMERLGGGLQ